MKIIENLPDFSKFTTEERKQIYEIVKTIVYMANKSRREGILALEEDMDEMKQKISSLSDMILYRALMLVVDGNDEDVITAIISNFIKAEKNAADVEKFGMNEALAGILCIQAGENPRLIKEYMLSMTGFAGEAEFKELYPDIEN